ncbi:MAG: hypothetical protein E7632_07475 [Ruminococcaceae bacterium]|nr:hypothetical protein [Oscillospiraceae bacterium]
MSETTRQHAAGVLLRMGVSMRMRGWDDLLTIVTLAAESPEPPDTAVLYAYAAEAAGVGIQTVRSRCSRAIRDALARGLPGVPAEMSAGAFIAAAAELVRREG